MPLPHVPRVPSPMSPMPLPHVPRAPSAPTHPVHVSSLRLSARTAMTLAGPSACVWGRAGGRRPGSARTEGREGPGRRWAAVDGAGPRTPADGLALRWVLAQVPPLGVGAAGQRWTLSAGARRVALRRVQATPVGSVSDPRVRALAGRLWRKCSEPQFLEPGSRVFCGLGQVLACDPSGGAGTHPGRSYLRGLGQQLLPRMLPHVGSWGCERGCLAISMWLSHTRTESSLGEARGTVLDDPHKRCHSQDATSTHITSTAPGPQ